MIRALPRCGSEFTANFRERGELGAAVCVTVRGSVGRGPVAAAGADWRRRQWAADTLVNVFSVGKGLIAACVAQADRGAGCSTRTRRDPVLAGVRRGGQGRTVTVRAAAQPSGGPARAARGDAGWQRARLAADDAVLAAEEPWWPPGAGHGYHVNTFGFLAGELIRRVTGLTPGEFLPAS